MRASVIGKLENECVAAFLEHEEEILAGTFEGSLIDHIAERQKNAYKECEKTSFAKIYHSKPVLDIELSGYKIMATLMEVFVDAAINPTRFDSQATLAPGKQSVRHKQREYGGANHGCNRLYQRNDRHLCARHLSEDQRYQSAYCIREAPSF